jgi:uncharacterized protein YuzE
MKVSYDEKVDALYINIASGKADGVIEVKEGINIDVSKDGKILGIELLDASENVSLKSFSSYIITPSLMKLKKTIS